MSPEVLEPDLSEPGTYVLFERAERDARARVVNETPFVYPRGFASSSLELQRFDCPPGWYGFQETEPMELHPLDAAAERDALAAAWPAPDGLQPLAGPACREDCPAWAFVPSLETAPFARGSETVPSGSPISTYSSCEASTVFFDDGGGLLSSAAGVRRLFFEDPVIAAVPATGGRFWTLGPAEERIRERAPVRGQARRLVDVRGIVRRTSAGPVGVRMDTSAATLIGDRVRVLPHDSTVSLPPVVPTIVETERGTLLVAAGPRGAHEIFRDATRGPEELVGQVQHIRGFDGVFHVLSGPAEGPRQLGRLRFDGAGWWVEPTPPACSPAGMSAEPVGIEVFRGLLVLFFEDSVLLQSPVAPACRTARFPRRFNPAVVVRPETLLVWGDGGFWELNADALIPGP